MTNPNIPDDSEIKKIAKDLKNQLQCNCDLDKWEPEKDTGHSFVCRIHKRAKEIMRNNK